MAGSQLSHQAPGSGCARVAGTRGAAVPRGGIQLTSNPPETEPRGRTWALAPGRPARPRPARAPLTAGPGAAAALTARPPLPALRAAGASPGAPLLRRARGRGTGSGRCPRGQGQLACAPRRSGSGASPGPGGLAGGGRRRRCGLLPPAEGGRAWGGKRGGEAALAGGASAPNARGGGAVPPAARGSAPAAGAPWHSRLSAPRGPDVRGRNPTVRTFEAGIQGSEGARLGLWRSERRWLAPSPGGPRGSRGRLRVPSAVRSGSPTRKPKGTRAPPAALTPRADGRSAAPSGMHHRAWFWAVLDSTWTAVFSPFSFFFIFFR